MTPSRLLTAHPPTSDVTDLLDSDCTKRNVVLPAFGFVSTWQSPTGTGVEPSSTSTTPTSTGSGESECDAYDASINGTVTNPDHTLVARPWTGTPIRAIVPLPRRKLGANGAQNTAPSPRRVPSHHCHGSPLCWTRSAHVWDDVVDTDSGAENADEDVEDGGSDEDCDVPTPAASRCCSYESITAAQGLSAWSFEELRVECYAQSSVARGTKPPPVVQPALAIPPAFVPRSVPRSETWRSLPTKSK